MGYVPGYAPDKREPFKESQNRCQGCGGSEGPRAGSQSRGLHDERSGAENRRRQAVGISGDPLRALSHLWKGSERKRSKRSNK